MTYFIKGQPVTPGSEKGAGGAAIVYAGTGQFSHLALKIWKPFASESDKQLAIQKTLVAMKLPFSPKIFKPLDLITSDREGKHPVGFTMNLYPTGYIELDTLADTATWATYGLTQRDVAQVLLNLYDLHIPLHAMDVLIADGNPRNFMFNPLTFDVIAGDVDAYQMGPKWPSSAGHVEYLSPRRYKSLPPTAQPEHQELMGPQDKEYLPEHDWWTFMINSMRSLLRAHPFREGTTGVSSPTDRVLLGLHVFKIPPPVRTSFPMKSLPDEWLSFTMGVFDAKQAELPLRDMLVRLANPKSWIVCNQHTPPAVYPIGRTECPHCAKDKSVPAITAAVITGLVQFIIKPIHQPATKTQLVFAESVDLPEAAGVIHALCLIGRSKKTELTVTFLGPNGVLSEMKLPIKFSPGQSYAVNGKYLMVTHGEQVEIFTHDGKLATSVTTEMYQRRSVASLSELDPMWLIGASLTLGKDLMGKIYPESQVDLSFGNVWLDTSSHSNVICGFMNWLNGVEWFTVSDFVRKPLAINFQPGEFLLDWRVVFSSKCFAVIRRTQMKKASERLVTTVFSNDGTLMYEEVLPQDTNIRSIGLKSDGSMWVPTDTGVMLYEMGKPAHILPGTENVHDNVHIVVVNDQPVIVDESGNIFILRSNK